MYDSHVHEESFFKQPTVSTQIMLPEESIFREDVYSVTLVKTQNVLFKVHRHRESAFLYVCTGRIVMCSGFPSDISGDEP